MAILQSCCCWKSVRKGSYASAIYTATYFGIMVIVMSFFVHEERHYYWQLESEEEESTGGNKSTKKPMATSFLEPEGISETSMTFNIVVLACACCGILASAILICGLYIDNRLLLLPWILVVMCTSIVDLSHIVYLIVLESMKFNPFTSILFTADFFLLTINIYSLLCVVSQYQEYKAGRGTAQYDDFSARSMNLHRSQLPMIRYEAPPTTSGGTKRSPAGRPPHTNTTTSGISVVQVQADEGRSGEEEEEEGWRKKRCPKRVQFPEDGGEGRAVEEEEDSRGAVVFMEGGGWPPMEGQSAMLLLSSSSVAAAAAVVVATDTAPLLSPKPTSSAPPIGQAFFAQGLPS